MPRHKAILLWGPKNMRKILPFLIGLGVALLLYSIFRWWPFLVLFPWVGFSVSTAMHLQQTLHGKQRLIGRKIALLMILPALLIFIPVINNENFQLEGVVMIVLVGFFSKGFIHYSVAKIFGPLIWRRGFCGYACWTAAVLEWLPIKNKKSNVPRAYRNVRFISLLLSIGIPVYLIFVLSYDPWTDYINKTEMKWMFVSNAVYYALGISLAFVLHDKRAFCKYLCPVALVMTPTSALGALKKRPNPDAVCTACGVCNKYCPMGVDVMSFMKKDRPITDTECILCSDCSIVCPENKVR